MHIEETAISGVYLINNFFSQDKRGTFIKTFHTDAFAIAGLRTDFRESYYSTSVKDVIRGMHFQLPPYDHAKLVYVTSGEILDVVVDLRKKSTTFQESLSFNLKAEGKSIYIPRGCAHGFLTLSSSATVVYNVTSVYAMSADYGIRWNSFGFNWPVVEPIISERDAGFISLTELEVHF